MFNKKFLIGILLAILLVSIFWLMTTDNSTIWPIRNTVQYRLLLWWRGGQIAPPTPGVPGVLQGTVQNSQGQPIGQARVLVSAPDGTTYSTWSDETGQYTIKDIPPASYWPVVGAPGYESVQLGGQFKAVTIRQNAIHQLDITLSPSTPRSIAPGKNFSLAEAETRHCTLPIKSEAIRRQIHFDNPAQPNQISFYYTPISATVTSQYPLLLTIYPGPADSWDCASTPLAAAGYAVIATGPAYSFELEEDLDELERLIQFAANNLFPGSHPDQVAVLGGSYSSLHVQRLLQRGLAVDAAILLGPPTDMFDMRRRLENGTYTPPFGLDQAMVAVGLPSQEPLRYWLYSGAYHVDGNLPPLAILHSRDDDVVPFEQSELLADNLEQVGAPYEMHLFDGAGHYLLEEGAAQVYEIALDFLARQFE